MRTLFARLVCSLSLILLISSATFAQNITISGTVKDKATDEGLAGVAITVKSKSKGTVTDESGNFKLTTSEKTPLTIVITYIGYQSIEQTISASTTDLTIQLESQSILGQEVVVAASRTPEKILESPVSIEHVSASAVREAAAPSFYDALVNLKGVESSAQSFTFRSLNTRGFNANGNVRFNQFIDGMDNQAPGLNFSVGNIVGISDLDIESVELLPGASSALYGAGGTNGTLIMNSKSPFKYPGLSASYKIGVNHIDNAQRDASPVADMSIRFAKVWNNRFAFKTNISYLQANDWQAQNYSNYNTITETPQPGTRSNTPNYNGVNVYGDEPFRADQPVTRTGYEEKDLVDYNSRTFKTSNSIHYKFGRGLEAIAQANWGTGTSVYTGTARYALQNFTIGQYKLELKGNNFFVRGYTTQENSGDSYQATALATVLNEAWMPSLTADNKGWIPTYMGVATKNKDITSARAFADATRPEPGTKEFEQLKQNIISRPIGGTTNGAKFHDKTNLYHYEGMYNFTNLLNKQVEVLVGASYRIFNLNSEGTLFNDLNSKISINEYGGYMQVAKKLVQDRLKLATSVRYDKNENFEGRFTPRISAVYSVSPNNNIRLSYQTGFRNPTTQDQYIDLIVRPNMRIIGGLPSLVDKYSLRTNPLYIQEIGKATRKPYTLSDLKPESVQAYEIGYKGLLTHKLLVDVSYYYNSYKNFISMARLVQPVDPTGAKEPNIFIVPVNNPNNVEAQGIALGIDYKLGNYKLSTNGSYNNLTTASSDLVNDFNTPKYRFTVGVGNREIIKNLGFNVSYRWQDQFRWSSTFASGNVPAFGTLDAQVSFKLPAYKSTIKLGGSNLLNKYYITSFGNPQVGGVYYASLIFDQLMK